MVAISCEKNTLAMAEGVGRMYRGTSNRRSSNSPPPTTSRATAMIAATSLPPWSLSPLAIPVAPAMPLPVCVDWLMVAPSSCHDDSWRGRPLVLNVVLDRVDEIEELA